MISKIYSPTLGGRGALWVLCLWGLSILAGVSCYGWAAHSKVARNANSFNPVPQTGNLLIAGGGNLSQQAKRHFVRLAGGANAHLVMIPGHYLDPSEAENYYDRWRDFEPASLQVLSASSAEQANDPLFTAALDNATGVWLGGGQQEWLTSCYRGTLVETKIRQVLARQGIVGGTSAGAAVMSEIMITGGRKTPAVDRGFGLLPGVVVDQHFIKRNRFSRLRSVIEEHADLIGLGIDEDSALLVSLCDRRVKVVGDSYVVLCWMNRFGPQSRVEVDFYNPDDEFQLQP